MKSTMYLVPLLLLLVAALVACTDGAQQLPTTTPESIGPIVSGGDELPTDDQVTLRESTVSWETYQYELSADNGLVPGSYDGVTKVRRTYTSWILENRFLSVTLVPELGGRILSVIYKPTGHEELYQNPVGVPYQIGTGVFYYDWLMVFGGIFPTFPEPEHGKTWLLPWEFEVVSESDHEVVVAMSIVDDIDFPNAPRQYNIGPSGIEVTYTVSLTAGRAAVDTRVTLTNPSNDDVAFEYWTNTTLAPGSDPLDPKTTAGAEIIAPIDEVKIPGYWRGIAAQEEATGMIEVYEFVNLRDFANWPDMGIAYAFPDMGGRNFWGVINHDNEEGIFRVADNTLSPGLKIWTWGFPHSTAVDPHATADESRPYIELWAGVTREFWQRTVLGANSQLEIDEIYAPSVGLTDVTHANRNFLVNLSPGGPTSVDCQLFGLYPEQTVNLSMGVAGVSFYEDRVVLDAHSATDCSTEMPETTSGGTLNLAITSKNGAVLFEGAVELSTEK